MAWIFCAFALMWIAFTWTLVQRASWVGLVGLASSLAVAVVLIAARDAMSA